MAWDVMTMQELDIAALIALRKERIAAIRVADYCTSGTAERVSKLLMHHPERTNYRARWAHGTPNGESRAPSPSPTDVDRVGPVDSAPEIHGDPTATLTMIREIRNIAAPELAPIDRLRLELDEIAPHGAGLHRDRGRLHLSGVGRVMEDSQELVHADVGRRNCLTANVYLRMPSTGGGTRIWRFDGSYRRSAHSYKFSEGEMPPETASCVIEPRPGDLVIWNPALPHAVLGFDDPPRVTLQTWLWFDADANATDFGITLLN